MCFIVYIILYYYIILYGLNCVHINQAHILDVARPDIYISSDYLRGAICEENINLDDRQNVKT